MVPLVQGARLIGTDMVDFYLAGESGDNHLTETPENLQVFPLCFVFFLFHVLSDEYGCTLYALIYIFFIAENILETFHVAHADGS